MLKQNNKKLSNDIKKNNWIDFENGHVKLKIIHPIFRI